MILKIEYIIIFQSNFLALGSRFFLCLLNQQQHSIIL